MILFSCSEITTVIVSFGRIKTALGKDLFLAVQKGT